MIFALFLILTLIGMGLALLGRRRSRMEGVDTKA
jgi:hypothetical protein